MVSHRFAPITLLLLLGAVCCAAEIYVASDGDDEAAGTRNAPLATVGAAIEASAGGDQILLRRGDRFIVSDLQLQGGRTLSAYGSGGAPVLSGALRIAAWESLGAGRYRAAVSACEQLWSPTGRQPRARYPDSGWLRTQEGTTADRLLLEGVDDPAGSWDGALVRWRRWSWWYETRIVDSDAGAGDLALAARDFNAPNNVGIGSGCYLEAAGALDAEGEWWFADGAVELFSGAGAPSAGAYDAVVHDRALTLSGGAVVEGVTIREYVGSGGVLRITGAATVRDCLIERISYNGITGVWNAFGSTISGNRFADIHGNAISWNENFQSAGGTVIADNQFDRIGVVPGLGGNGSWKASGVVISNGSEAGDGVIIRRNRFADIGYCGVILGSDGQVVEHNVFFRCLSTHNDGGAIYTNSHANIIRENIIIDSVGDTSSSQPWTPLGHGIWPEFLSDFRDHQIIGNTVYGCAGHGLYLPNNFTALVQENTFISNRRGGIGLGGRGDAPEDLPQDNELIDNILGIGARPYSTDRPETLASWNQYSDFDRCLQYASPDPDKNRGDYDYGSLSGTVLVRPSTERPLLTAGNAEKSIADWQGEEADWADADPTVVEAPVFLFINDTASAVAMSLPTGDWTTLAGDVVTSSVMVAAWRSVPLRRSAIDDDLPGYLLASEQADPTVERRIGIDADGVWRLGVGAGPIDRSSDRVEEDGTQVFDGLDAGLPHRLAAEAVSGPG